MSYVHVEFGWRICRRYSPVICLTLIGAAPTPGMAGPATKRGDRSANPPLFLIRNSDSGPKGLMAHLNLRLLRQMRVMMYLWLHRGPSEPGEFADSPLKNPVNMQIHPKSK
jgi:hypothetical protein